MALITEPLPASNELLRCQAEADVRSACADESSYGDFQGKRYCVLHFPSKKKGAAFGAALKRKMDAKDFNFSGVWFPDEVQFLHTTFKAKVDFFKATFNAPANFSSATFKGPVSFRECTFIADAHFDHANFHALAIFSQASFGAKADFQHASFSRYAQTYFAEATFNGEADFREATFDSLADFGRVTFKVTKFDKASFNDQSVFTEACFGDEASFFRASFTKEAAFRNAGFKSYANFSFTTFEEAEFRDASFSVGGEANFRQALFGTRASFSYTRFGAEVLFTSATFKTQAYFSKVTFGGRADFSYALFDNFAKFAGDKHASPSDGLPSLDFQHARIEKPDHFSFVGLSLRPHWFMHVDLRKLDFTDVRWEGGISQEIEELEKKEVSSPGLLLAIIYRQLAVNAEDNHRYEEASKFRYRAMELQRDARWRDFVFWDGLKGRISKRLQRFSGRRLFAPFTRDWLYWLYWAASGYGERILRGFFVLIGIWLLFAWLYMRVDFNHPGQGPATVSMAADKAEAGEPLRFKRALIYSLGVMSLQRPDPRPLTNSAYTLVALQTILGPLQAALLALAFRRKFMR